MCEMSLSTRSTKESDEGKHRRHDVKPPALAISIHSILRFLPGAGSDRNSARFIAI
jgi:hypothetical protein